MKKKPQEFSSIKLEHNEYPVSPLQNRIWIYDHLDQTGQLDIGVIGFVLDGKLDIKALGRAFDAVVARHQILRTCYPNRGGAPRLRILPEETIKLQVSELPIGPLESGERLQELLKREYDRTFSLESGPLLRATVYVSPSSLKHVLVMAAHHIVCDEWSLGIFFEGLSRNYSAIVREPAWLSSASEYLANSSIVSQLEWLEGAEAERMLEAIEKKFDGIPEIDIPFVTPNDETAGSASALRVAEDPSELLDRRIQDFSKKHGISLAMFYLGVFGIVLARHCRTDRLVIGVPVAGRTHLEEEDKIGCFANVVPVPLSIEPSTSVPEFFRSVRKAIFSAFSSQKLPLPLVVERLCSTRRKGRNPLFDILYSFHSLGRQILDLEGLTLTPIPRSERRTTFQCELHVDRFEETSFPRFYFPQSRTDASSAEIFVSHFHELIKSILGQTDAPLGSLSMLSEWDLGLQDGSRVPKLTVPAKDSIHERFEARVKAAPNQIAVCCGDRSATYCELNRLANRVAHRVRTATQTPGTLIGLCVNRSIELIAGILGILKAGSAYLPLDPSNPQERLLFMIEDARPQIVLANSDLVERVSSGTSTTMILEDVLAEGDSDEQDGRIGTISPHSLAYGIYTSGSTGRPKAALVTHHNVLRLFTASEELFRFSSSDIWTMFHSYSFDFSVWEIWGALLYGGRLIIVPDDVRRAPEAMWQLIVREGVTVLNQTPSAFYELAKCTEKSRRDIGALRLIAFNGEALNFSRLAAWFETYGEAAPQLINMYGPTETTVNATYYKLSSSDASRSTSLIGQPVPDLTVHVLDANLHPVPIGIVGELYIGGDGVGEGYLNRPRLTAERFIPDPTSQSPGKRLYRTGDLVREMPDGNLEFVERSDGQIKLRGYRIELGEVEFAMEEHGDVERAIVIVREDVPGNQVLVCYVLPTSSHTLTASILYQHASRLLPNYMVPGAFVLLRDLPLTENGKVNKRVLPIPSRQDLLETTRSSPSTKTEREVLQLWQTSLGNQEIGIDDDFFRLGGHSLLALQIISGIAESYGVTLPLRSFFEMPTIRAIASELDGNIKGNRQHNALLSDRTFLAARASDQPFPLAPLQEALWVGQNEAFELGNTTTYAYIELDWPDLDINRFETAFNRLIARHDMLRAIFLPDGTQKVLAEVPRYPITTVDLTHGAGAELGVETIRSEMRNLKLGTDHWPAFDLRASRGMNSTALHIAFSALIVDATSHEILFKELAALYQDDAVVLPPLGYSYREYVATLRHSRTNETFKAAERYWTHRLQLPVGPPDLTFNTPPETITNPTFAKMSARIDARRWVEAKIRGARFSLTPSAIVLTAYARILALWAKDQMFLINVLQFNRPPLHPQIREVVGNFSAPLIYLADCSRTSTFRQHAVALQQSLWEDLEHSIFDGVQVIRYLTRAQGISPHALAPVVFTTDLGQTRQKRLDQAKRTFESLQASQIWLECKSSETDGDLVLEWDWVSNLFPDGMIDDMFDAFVTVLESLSDDAGWEAAQLAPLPERSTVFIRHLNDSRQDIPASLLHSGLMIHAQIRPDHPAIISFSHRIGYSQLHNASATIAAELLALGADTSRPIAVFVNRGWKQIAALTGILYAGAAYLPIDKTTPLARVERILIDAQCSTVIVDEDLSFSAGMGDVLTYQIAESVLDTTGSSYEPADISQEQLAYVIYTSGSTGMPKGVMISHASATNTILDINRRFQVSSSDKVLTLSSIGFDLSVYDIFGMISAGGTIVIPDLSSEREPGKWIDLIRDYGVTIWNSVPTLMQMLIEYAANEVPAGLPDTLRLCLLSGDWIPLPLPEAIARVFPASQVVSLGGATEAAIWSVFHPIERVEQQWKSIPYGRPLANQTLHIVGHDLRPKPLWAVGQILIGGEGIALGYRNDPSKTKQAFVGVPWSERSFYRTGDLGRLSGEGFIEFLGREDSQVKIGGYRIELGDIENALVSIDGVSQAVVIPVDGANGSRRMIGFVVAEDGRSTLDHIAGALEDIVPRYMIPSDITQLTEIPLTANGKVDRKKLLEIAYGRESQVAHSYSPADQVEETLREMWEDQLNVDIISKEDNFFDKGGDSITATRLLANVRKTLGVSIRLRDFFDAPTFEALIACVRHNNQERSEVDTIITPRTRKSIVSLIDMQKTS